MNPGYRYPWPASALSPDHMSDLHYMSIRTHTPVTVLVAIAVEALTGKVHTLAPPALTYCGPHCLGGHPARDDAPLVAEERTA